MKKNFYLLLLSVLPLLLPGCFPAKKAIILPEQERAERYEPGARAAAEDRLKNVPEILLKSSNIAKDERSQKHADSAMEPIPGREEALASSEAPPQTPFAIELPDPKYVSHRLTKYTRVLNEWNEMAEDMVALDAGAEWPEQWHECVQGLEYMVAGYGRLKTLLQPGAGGRIVAQGINPWEMVQRDVHYLESNCGTVFKRGLASSEALAADYLDQNANSLQTLIQQLMAQGDYQGAISIYENSAAVLQGEKVDFTTQSLYAQALVHSNRLEEALQLIGEKMRHEGVLEGRFLEQSRDLWRAAIQYADLLLILGKDQKAKSVYLQLDDLFAALKKDSEWVEDQLHFVNDYKSAADKYSAFIRLLREYMQYDGRGIPPTLQARYEMILADFDDTGLDSLAARVMRKTEEQARQWAREKLLEVDYLTYEKDFRNARNILEALTNIPADMIKEVAGARESLARLEKEDAQIKRALERDKLGAQWENAVILFEAEEYEKAIDAFSFLSGSEYGIKAQKKAEEAIDKLTVRLRKEAAELFIKATNIKDPAEKTKLMMQSRDVLLYILNRYPEATIVGKVKENLQVLEDRIRVFSPDL